MKKIFLIFLFFCFAACVNDNAEDAVEYNEEAAQAEETPAPVEMPAPEIISAPEEPEIDGLLLHHVSFEEEDFPGNGGGQVSVERVTDFGMDDDFSLLVTNTTGNFTSGAGNFFRMDLTEPLVDGGTYLISWSVYIPSDRNPDKSTIPGGGINFNGEFGSPNHQPTDATDLNTTTPMDTWTTVQTEFTLDHLSGNVDNVIFRFRVNEEDRQPSVWYIDNIKIYELELSEAIFPEWDMSLPSLAERYADYFYIGNILEPNLINSNPMNVIDMFLHQYNAVTAENAMKVNAVGGNRATRPESLNFGGANAIVNFAERNDLYMVGHTLVWHSQSSPWLYQNADGTPLTRAEALDNMHWFIQQYAGEFEGRIHAWDVVNEAFTNGGGANIPREGPDDYPVYDVGTWQRALRNESPWYRAFANGADFEAGESAGDYIYYAFVFARRYAPSALLIYNDFNEESPHKRNAMANMTEELNERWYNDSENNPAFGNPNHPEYGRLLIEAIGMQAHYNASTNFDNVYLALERFAETGARIHVTELDIHFRGAVPAPFTMTEIQQLRQAEMFAQLFTWYMEFSDHIDRVTIWGREDSSSWRGDGAATHFDRFFRPKPAFRAIYDPENWRDLIN
ncbi:MAG: endo-1,4-beta-xylanase [Clostridiales bacterium]|jgi:GH35 family endo-1,4-beta-xylanase|nr:endo-1,4-beta-xylanase [Clostridiales bacterium]